MKEINDNENCFIYFVIDTSSFNVYLKVRNEFP